MFKKIINKGLVTFFVASITWFSVPASAYNAAQDSHLTEQERHRIYERQQANRNYNQNAHMTDQERRRAYEQNRANQNSHRYNNQNNYNRHDSRWNKRCVYYKNHHRHVRNKRSCRR